MYHKPTMTYRLYRRFRHQWRRHLVACLVCVMVFGGYGVFLHRPLYQAESTVLVSQPSDADITTSLRASERLVGTYAEIARSHTVMNHVIDHLNLSVTTHELQEWIQVVSHPNLLLLEIQVNTTDPGLSQAIANEVAWALEDVVAQYDTLYSIQVFDGARFPSEPRGLTFQNIVILGLIVGLVLPVLSLYLDERRNPIVLSAHDLEHQLDIPVHGILPDAPWTMGGTS
jgi:capsular polysaccharide biosynthesis protein